MQFIVPTYNESSLITDYIGPIQPLSLIRFASDLTWIVSKIHIENRYGRKGPIPDNRIWISLWLGKKVLSGLCVGSILPRPSASKGCIPLM